jgi:hypothetical protein
MTAWRAPFPEAQYAINWVPFTREIMTFNPEGEEFRVPTSAEVSEY